MRAKEKSSVVRKGKMKQADLSLTTIVVAILVLMVLVVVIVVFSGKFKQFSDSTANCAAKGGTCYTQETCPQGTTPVIGGGTCKEKKEICCVNIEAKP